MALERWPLGFADSPSYAAPLIPFTSFPDPLTVEGQVRRPAELPNVSLIALSGLWRPLGGRQVLAQRSNNPVTVQSLTAQSAETIGPFPGGLVRAGMRLQFDSKIGHSGIGAGTRFADYYLQDVLAFGAFSSVSGAKLEGRRAVAIEILADGSFALYRPHSTAASYAWGIPTILSASINMSLPWSLRIDLTSAAETPVTITGATWAGGVATYETSAPHTLAVADKTVVSGITPTGWNTTDIVSVVPDTTHFSVPMPINPGTYSNGGQSSRISNMVSQSYVLELVG